LAEKGLAVLEEIGDKTFPMPVGQKIIKLFRHTALAVSARLGLCVFMSILLLVVSCGETPEVKFQRLMGEGDTAFNRGEYKIALSTWLEAEDIVHNSVELYGRIGKAYLRLADYDHAKRSFKEAINLRPKAWQARLELAKLELATQDYDSAKKNWEAIENQINSSEGHVFHGDLLLFDQQYAEAEKAYQMALALNGDFKIAEIRLAICYLFQKKDDDAEKIYSALAEHISDKPEVLIQIGNFWNIKGDASKAEAYFKEAVKKAPDALIYERELADYYYSTGRYGEAYSVLDNMRLKSPSNRSINKFLVDTLLLQNRLQEANVFLTSLPQEVLGDLDWNLLKGKYYLLSGEHYNAVSHFSSVVDNEPNFPAGNYFLALAYLAAGQSNLAQKSAEKALTLDPDYTDAELLLTDIYYKKKEYDLSLEYAQRIIGKEPENYRAHLITGNLYLAQKQFKKALVSFANARELSPELLTSTYSMALTYELSGQTNKALALYRHILEQDPKVLDAASRYAMLLQKEKKIDEAKHFFNTLIRQVPDSSKHHQILGDIYGNTDETENAEKQYKKAIELQPAMTSSYFRLMDVYERTSNKEGIILTLQECINNNPSAIDAYIELARVYELSGESQQAQHLLEKAVKENPDSPYLKNSLAWFYLEQDINTDEAYLLVQSAHAKLPDDPAILDTLGWSYYKKDSLTRAMWTLNEALSLSPDNPFILFHLGAVYAARGDVAEAKKMLQKAHKNNLPQKKSEKAQSLLQSLEKQ
jgi:tetratricopeptide (TPR) repeat protein